MTLTEAAERLGLSKSTVRRRIQAGLLDATRDGRRVIITNRDIERYCARFRTPANGAPRRDSRVEAMFPNAYGGKDA